MRTALSYLTLTLGISIVFALAVPGQAMAQERSCEDLLVEANNLYSTGAFDETIQLLDQCINNENLSETERKTAYRLKGLSFIGKGLEVDAKESIKRLLQLVPNYEPDPVMDPPNFVQLITEVREEIDAELNTTTPLLEVNEPEVEQPAVLEAPPAVVTNSVKRKKKGAKKWIWGGLGVAAAGGLIAVLAGGSSSSGGDAISEPPALP